MSSAEAKLLWLVVGSAGCVARPPAPKAPAPEVRVEPREPALVTPPSVVFPPGVEEWTDAEGLDPGAEPTDTDDDPAEPIDPPPVSGPADAAMLARRAPQLLQWKKLPAAERLAVARDLAKLSVIGACEPYFEETEDAAAVDMPSVQVLRADLDRDGDRDAIVVMRGLCFYHGVGEGGLVVRIGDIASRPMGIAARFVGFGMLEQVVHLDERRGHLWLGTGIEHGAGSDSTQLVAYDVSGPELHELLVAPMNLSQFLEDGELTVRGKLRAERGGVRIDYVILDQTWDASIDDLRTTSTTRGWARHRWNEAEGLYRSSYGGDVDQAELELLFTDPLLEGEPKAP